MKEFLKKYLKEILITIAYILITYIVITCGIKFKLESNQVLKETITILFDTLISLITVWFSAYFILVQLYKNTYPMEVIEKEFIKKFKTILFFSIYNIFYGISLLAGLNENILTEIYFIVLFILNFVAIIFNTYMTNRSLTINTYVDKYFKKLSKSLKNEKIEKKEINEKFDGLEKFFNECIIKDEYSVCNNISIKMADFFKELIEECNKMILSNNEKLAYYIFGKIIDANINQIKLAKTSKIPSFYMELLTQQAENLLVCININNFELFKKYIIKLEKILISSSNNNTEPSKIYYIYNVIATDLIDKNSSWMEWFLEEIFSPGSIFIKGQNTEIYEYIKLLLYLLTYMVEEKKEDINEEKYKLIIKCLEDSTKFIGDLPNELFSKIILLYSLYGQNLLKEKNINKINDFINIICDEYVYGDKQEWSVFVIFYLNEINLQVEELSDISREKIVSYVLRLNSNTAKANYSNLFPDYKSIIVENISDKSKINKILEEIESIVFKLLLNDYENTLKAFITENISDTILEIDNEEIIKKLIKLIFKIYVYSNDEKTILYEFIIFLFTDLLEELDKKRKISEDLAQFIILEIMDTAESLQCEEKIYRICKFIVNIFNRDEDDKLYFLYVNIKNKKIFYKKIFNLGTSCIEDNMLKSLKEISNVIGWQIIEELKSDLLVNAKYLTNCAIDLYNFGKYFKLDESMMIYLMTLFTTIGTFCYTDNKYLNIKNLIFNFLKKERISRINAAIEIRTKENDIWEDLYQGKIAEYTNLFRKDINKVKKDIIEEELLESEV